MDVIEKAVSVLMHDGLVVYPTETVYGLGADAFSDEAILKVYEAKKRPLAMPVSIAVSDFDMLYAVARVEPDMEAFLATFLPGPVTVVLPARKTVPAILTGGTGLIGIRMPAHDLALRLIAEVRCTDHRNKRQPPRGKRPGHAGRVHGAVRVPDRWRQAARHSRAPLSTLREKRVLRAGADIDRVAKFLLTM